MLRTPLAWWPLQCPSFACLKAMNPMQAHSISWPIALLFIWTAGSVFFVLRARRRLHLHQTSTPELVQASPSDTLKHSGSTKESFKSVRQTGYGKPGHSIVGEDLRTTSKIAMAFRMLIPVALFLLVHVRLVTAILDHRYGTVKEESVQAQVSSGLQQVFQVYQPVPSISSGSKGCDLELLLMDHVFGSSYGKPFVGKAQMPRTRTLNQG
ncbi:hypothetical protein N7532_010428 [Penicillium argentinense]|uniref:Uncharacterized protein n=1 Tax=Penicillium argentinense TaxID=1131581 RepID=A0A9W9EPL8_9EURO|nr:uncharacterized protein N7532_010428 [Penicillium argentinense]KAJ5085657.1 hypothetical protein N7532_010428 [Penicillium argentinense]